jgi:ElaB/YqjD/DUF883 family membrane-anchored ribosome-binding protein
MTASTDIDQAADAADQTIQGAEKRFHVLIDRFEKAVQDGLELIRTQGRGYVDTAGEKIDTAQRYVVDQVQERPLTATVAALGVGVLLGLVISGRKR